MPFEVGNKHGAKRREFEQAIRRALASEDGHKLRRIADAVVELATAGERWAVEMLRDTLDGRPAQQIVATDDEGRSLAIALIAYSDPASLPAPALPAPDIEGTGQRH
jgi:hypothetical protein